MTTPDAHQADISDAELHAFADGQLPKARLLPMAAYLAEHPQAASQIASWQAQNAAIRALFTEEAALTPDEDLLRVRQIKTKAVAYSYWKLAIAASVLLVGGGLAGAWLDPFVRPSAKEIIAYGEQLADESVADFKIYAREKIHPVEVWADQKEHLVRWLTHTVGGPVLAPDLSDHGFKLVGGRLVTFHGMPGALIMYENTNGVRVTILSCRNAGERTEPLTLDREGEITTSYWTSTAASYAISGPLDPKLMQGVADTVLKQSRG